MAESRRSPAKSAPPALSPAVAELLSRHPEGGIVGFDEVGRGPLAGPVVAVCAVLPQGFAVPGITDSKVLSEAARDALFPRLLAACAWGEGWVWPDEIETLNIHHASLEAMRRAWFDLEQRFPLVAAQVRYGVSDGRFAPAVPFAVLPQVKGDLLVPAISVASIIAKVKRDAYMVEQDALYPAYGFARHKGYPTPEHQKALRESGPCPIHRPSWAAKIILSSS